MQSNWKFLTQRRDVLRKELLVAQPLRFAEFLEIDEALRAISVAAEIDFAQITKPGEAIKEYLRKLGRMQSKKKMCEEIRDAGFQRGKYEDPEEPYWNLIDSANYMLGENQLIRRSPDKRDDFIGLPPAKP